MCLKGSFKRGTTEEDGCRFEYLSDKNPRVLEITPGIYHGYKALEPGSILLYYVTRKYDVEDEIRSTDRTLWRTMGNRKQMNQSWLNIEWFKRKTLHEYQSGGKDSLNYLEDISDLLVIVIMFYY